MPSHHYLSSTYLKILVQANESLINSLEIALGFSITDLLSNKMVDGEEVDRIFEIFHQYGLDSWILRYGQQFGLVSHGPLGFAALSAPNLETAINVAADYIATRLSFFDCQFSQDGQRSNYIYHSKTNNKLTEQWMVESGIHVVKQLIETIITHPVGDNATINFVYPEPEYKLELEEFYGVKCNFNTQQNSISIPTSWCQIRSPMSDQSTYQSNLRKCQEAKLSLVSDLQTADAVRLTLNHYFENNPLDESTPLPSLSSLAADKHMSPRTFSRRLKKQGSSYKQLLEEVRQKQASQLLINTHLSIADIGLKLGYQEPANFIRAFKQWNGCTPSQWRKK